jgi:hypothetical protein
VTFRDIQSGNISEDVLRASISVPDEEEKSYALDRVESSCQTEELPVVRINPVSFLSLSPSAVAELRRQAKEEKGVAMNGMVNELNGMVNESVDTMNQSTTQSTNPSPSTTTTPPPQADSTEPKESSSLNEVSTLRQSVSETAKDLRSRLELVRGRRQLKAEQAADEQEVRAAREERSRKVLQENADMLDETRVVLDNLVNHFQSISSRYNRKFTRAMTVRAEERRGDRRNAGRHRRGGREEPGAVRGADEVDLREVTHAERVWWRSRRSSWRTSSVIAPSSLPTARWWSRRGTLTPSVRHCGSFPAIACRR